MKAFVNIIFCISLILNIYFLFQLRKFQAMNDFGKIFIKSNEINKTNWNDGFETFKKKIEFKNRKKTKYYYINTWANFCKPCILEMPLLDSIANTINTDISFVFVSSISDNAANYCLQRYHYDIKKFIFLNDMNDLISSICNELKTDSRVYPMHLIVDQDGKVFYYSIGAFGSLREAKKLIEILKKLPE